MVIFQDLNAQRGRGRYNNNRNYRNYGYSNRNYGYNNYNRYSPYRGRTFISFSSPRVMIPFGGVSYHYSSGYYYRPYGGYYRSVFPPVGIHINILPRGYRTIYAGPDPYYYYGGTYYRQKKDAKDYEVVDAPLGASVPELPEGAKVVVINDQKYYELSGTYYKEDIRDNSEIWYTVVGKDGKLNTDEITEPVVEEGPVVGDIIDKLPDNCRTVVVSGNKYFVSPDDVYYEEVTEHNTLKYKIVGK